MRLHIAEEVSAATEWGACTTIGMAPRDPDEEDEDDDDDEEEEDRADEPAVVREPDDD